MYFVRPVTKHFSLFLHTDTLSREITNLFKPLLLVFQSGTILKLVCWNNNFLSYFQSFKMPPRWCISALAWKIVLIFYPSLSLSLSLAKSFIKFAVSTCHCHFWVYLDVFPLCRKSLFLYIICPVHTYSIICLVLLSVLSCSINCSFHVLSSVLFYQLPCPAICLV